MKQYFTYTEELIQGLESFAGNSEHLIDMPAINMFPELLAAFELDNRNTAAYAIEHDSKSDNVLWAHIHKILKYKLSGVEKRDIALFQQQYALDELHFEQLCKAFHHIDKEMHLSAVLRAALVFSDISKGGNAERRLEWKKHYGMDLSIHNQASAILLRETALLNRYIEFRHSAALQNLTIFMVNAHGLIGQYVRGEITGELFEPVVTGMMQHACELQQCMQLDNNGVAIHAIVQLYLLMNVLDTAAVREGLMNNELLDKFIHVAELLENASLNHEHFPCAPTTSNTDTYIKVLYERLLALRNGVIQMGESPENVRNALDLLNDTQIDWFYHRMLKCQLWYFEAATGRLSAQSQLKMLIMGLYFYNLSDSSNDKIFHVDFFNIANMLSPVSEKISGEIAKSRSGYRVRILDAMLAAQDIHRMIDGSAEIYQNKHIFMMKESRGGDSSISLNIVGSEESEALITLLSIYERKSAVAFHSALKMLCDLYHLRKDEFDRLSNESQYLVTMNAAKNDKARMMNYLKPGKIVEVGPGGGVVLDLLESHFPDSEIIGLDASHQVVVALEQRKKQSHAKWQIIEGNAFAFEKYFSDNSLNDIVFCSILHEIYSYIEAEDGTRFHVESVQKMLQSAFKALAPGGRILIRDGIMPDHKPQYLSFIAEDARPFFDAFCREFKGRKIDYQTVDDNTVLLDSADAMEFMYTYTWGPESFPYEVREQYGVMTYSDYCQSILSWLGDKARIVELPDSEALVLQPGYVTALKDKVRLMDVTGNPAPFPPSNAIIVIEKCK